MATRIFLVRHAAHDLLGRTLAGRMAGVDLSDVGRAQAARLAAWFAGQGLAAVMSSPLQRARETAAPIAAAAGCEVAVSDAFDEIDFGAWTGWSFADLEEDPQWRRWNAARHRARPPGGEAMLDVQSRWVAGIESHAADRAGGSIAIVGHADPIKAALAHYLGLPVDHIGRFDVDPGSVSTVDIFADAAVVRTVNWAPA